MTIEIIVLAMASTIRPTSLAALYALLEHRSPRTLMVAYVLGGLAFTIAFGLVVVYVLHGIHIQPGTGRAKGIAEIVSGAVALGFGIALLTRHVHRSQEAPEANGRLNAMLDQHVTPRVAALAGPLTHIPGIFYLIALNVIVAHHLRVTEGTLDVVTYNAIWFALPILALVTCITNPALARVAVGSADQWARQNSRAILLCVSFVAGAGLIVRGALTV
jgi:hypothetical protein